MMRWDAMRANNASGKLYKFTLQRKKNPQLNLFSKKGTLDLSLIFMTFSVLEHILYFLSEAIFEWYFREISCRKKVSFNKTFPKAYLFRLTVKLVSFYRNMCKSGIFVIFLSNKISKPQIALTSNGTEIVTEKLRQKMSQYKKGTKITMRLNLQWSFEVSNVVAVWWNLS